MQKDITSLIMSAFIITNASIYAADNEYDTVTFNNKNGYSYTISKTTSNNKTTYNVTKTLNNNYINPDNRVASITNVSKKSGLFSSKYTGEMNVPDVTYIEVYSPKKAKEKFKELEKLFNEKKQEINPTTIKGAKKTKNFS